MVICGLAKTETCSVRQMFEEEQLPWLMGSLSHHPALRCLCLSQWTFRIWKHDQLYPCSTCELGDCEGLDTDPSEIQDSLVPWFLPPALILFVQVKLDFVCALSRSVVSSSLPSMDCSPPGSSVHGVSQARILEWVAIPFSTGSSWTRDRTHVSCVSCIAGTCFSTWEDQVEMKLNRMVTPKRTPWRLKATLLCLGNERSFGIFQERLATCLPLEFLP